MDLISSDRKRALIPFASIGEYPLHTHWLRGEELGETRPFNCTVRDHRELVEERVELHLGEELHAGLSKSSEYPLLRFNRDGLFAWMRDQELWFPCRRFGLSLALDQSGQVRLKFDQNHQMR